MILLGNTALRLRKSHGLTQRETAEALGISVVHLCNVEKNKSAPSPALLERYRELWGVDLYVLAWCLHGDIDKLPQPLRKSARALAKAWQDQLGTIATMRTESEKPCSKSDK